MKATDQASGVKFQRHIKIHTELHLMTSSFSMSGAKLASETIKQLALIKPFLSGSSECKFEGPTSLSIRTEGKLRGDMMHARTEQKKRFFHLRIELKLQKFGEFLLVDLLRDAAFFKPANSEKMCFDLAAQLQ